MKDQNPGKFTKPQNSRNKLCTILCLFSEQVLSVLIPKQIGGGMKGLHLTKIICPIRNYLIDQKGTFIHISFQ